MKVLCISASNILHSKENSISQILCSKISEILREREIIPIPAKLSMILEKMEEITFLHWWKDNNYKSEVCGVPTGIISHGGAPDWALKSYKAMVNDTIANALDTIQCKTIPYSSEWNTGISLPVQKVLEESSIFPIQKYDWNLLTQKLKDYIGLVLKEV